jgi:outer membrane protein
MPRRFSAGRYGLVTLCAFAPILVGAGGGTAMAQTGQEAAADVPAMPPPTHILTLNEAERAAVASQPQLLVARAATATALAQADQARAPLLPQVTATAEYARQGGINAYAYESGKVLATSSANSQSSMVGTPSNTGAANQSFGQIVSTSTDVWLLELSATQLIYDFGQTYEKLKAADLTADASSLTERSTLLTTMLNVRSAYFNARAMKELVGVARETLDDQNKHLVQVKGQVTVGTQPQIALAQQLAAVANAKVSLITAQNNYEVSKSQLNQAAGLTTGTDYDVGNEELAPLDDEDQPLTTLAPKAIAARPEMASFVKQRESQEATLRSAKGGYGPQFLASAAALEAGTDSGLSPGWSAALVLNWPIFQGGLTKGQIRQAEAGIKSVDAQKALEELQIRLGVDSARLAVHAAKATIGAANDALTSSREQLRLAEQRFATGVGDIIELNDAQVAYTSAAAQVVQAHFNLATARAQLLSAMGRP